MTQTETADLIVTNAVVRTMDPAQPAAEAFAVAGGKLLAVGSASDVAAFKGASTRVVDLDGQAVMPGLMDVHNHHGIAGLHNVFELKFPDTAGVDEICAAVEQYIAQHPELEWVQGSIWGSQLLAELSTPEPLRKLDAVSGDKKVLLTDDSHHNRFANTAAMRAAGIQDDSPDPAGGGVIVRADGRPTGLLFEGAGVMVSKAAAKADPMTTAKAAACSADAIKTMHAVGVTAFLDAGATLHTLNGLKALDDSGDLKIWASSCMLINDHVFGAETLADDLFPHREVTRSAHHRPDFAKIFLDGVPMSYTGAFLEPYLPSESHGCAHKGHTTMPYDELEHWLLHCAAKGINVKVHCCGDASVRFVLDAVAKVRAAGHSDTLFHVAHGQFVNPDDIKRFRELGVVADISPPLWYPSIIVEAMEAVRPKEEIERMAPNRSLAESGAIISGGSDWPVMPDPNPWTGIAGLITRADPLGQHPGQLAPDEAISIDQALAAYTINTARALGIEAFTGSLTVGKSADFVVLDRDPYAVAPEKLASTVVRETWFEGEKVYSKA
jgi:predicted amidohydrolase YtcJ